MAERSPRLISLLPVILLALCMLTVRTEEVKNVVSIATPTWGSPCLDGPPAGPGPKFGMVPKNIVRYLLKHYGSKKSIMANYHTAAQQQCECYTFGSNRIRPPFLPDNNATLEEVFIGSGTMPKFSADSTFFFISAHISLFWEEVVILIADHMDSEYHVSSEQRKQMKHGSEEVDVYCDFIDHHLAEGKDLSQKMFGPAEILSHDDHHVRKIKCKSPKAMIQCLKKPLLGGTPRCIDVALRTRPKGDRSAPALTVSLLQVCQFEKPRRNDTLVTCTAPMNSKVFHLVAPWIEYHHRLGIERFYLYAEDLGLEKYIPTYMARNITEIILWMDPRKKPFWPIDFRPLSQVAAMNDCIYRFMDHAQWIAFFDVDEWFQPFKHSLLTPFFTPHSWKNVGALKVWTWYFSHKAMDDGAEMLLLDNNMRDQGVTEEARKRCKNVIQPKRVQMVSVHLVMHGAETVTVSEKDLRLNHYRYNGELSVKDDSMKQFEDSLISAMQDLYAQTIPEY